MEFMRTCYPWPAPYCFPRDPSNTLLTCLPASDWTHPALIQSKYNTVAILMLFTVVSCPSFAQNPLLASHFTQNTSHIAWSGPDACYHVVFVPPSVSATLASFLFLDHKIFFLPGICTRDSLCLGKSPQVICMVCADQIFLQILAWIPPSHWGLLSAHWRQVLRQDSLTRENSPLPAGTPF